MSPEDDDRPPLSWLRRAVVPRLRRGRRAAGDWARLFAGALGLNLRKTIWVLRGRAGPAPCQGESDSGRAGEAVCEASAGWTERRRFRRICPHLVRQAEGRWRCSVDAKRVRPFWGRALAWWGGTLAALWVLGTVPVWAVLWKTGVRVSYRQVVWPGAWKDTARARSQAYLARAERAMAAKQFAETLLCLQSALRSDPQNFTAQLYLANFAWWQGDYPMAKARLDTILRDFPDQRIVVARAWLPRLVAQGDTGALKLLASDMLAGDGAAPGPWAHALIFAARQTGDPAVLLRAMQRPGLPPAFGPVLAANAAGISGRVEEARKRLAELRPDGEQAAFVAYQQLDGLLEFGAPQSALAQLDHGQPVLDAAQLLFFRLRAYAQLGWSGTSLQTVQDSFHGIDLPHLNAIATYLVCCHDRPALLQTLEMMKQAPQADKLDVTFSLLDLAATLWGDRDLLPKVARLAVAKSPLTQETLDRFNSISLRPDAFAEALRVLPLPLEAMYAAHGTLRTRRLAAPRR